LFKNDIPGTLDAVIHVEEALEAVTTSELFDELGRLSVLRIDLIVMYPLNALVKIWKKRPCLSDPLLSALTPQMRANYSWLSTLACMCLFPKEIHVNVCNCLIISVCLPSGLPFRLCRL
jgi:hypothetical protein